MINENKYLSGLNKTISLFEQNICEKDVDLTDKIDLFSRKIDNIYSNKTGNDKNINNQSKFIKRRKSVIGFGKPLTNLPEVIISKSKLNYKLKKSQADDKDYFKTEENKLSILNELLDSNFSSDKSLFKDNSKRCSYDLYVSKFDQMSKLAKSVKKKCDLSTENASRIKTKFSKENLFKSVHHSSNFLSKNSFSEEMNLDSDITKTDSNETKFKFDKKEHKKLMKNLLENCHNQSHNEKKFHNELKKKKKKINLNFL